MTQTIADLTFKLRSTDNKLSSFLSVTTLRLMILFNMTISFKDRRMENHWKL